MPASSRVGMHVLRGGLRHFGDALLSVQSPRGPVARCWVSEPWWTPGFRICPSLGKYGLIAQADQAVPIDASPTLPDATLVLNVVAALCPGLISSLSPFSD